MRAILSLALLATALPALGQNTCFTGSTGTTICSTSGGVIHGNTNSVGNSVYRDDRGNRLDYQSNSLGNAKVQTPSGETVQWTQQVNAEIRYPQPTSDRPHPATARKPVPLDTWLKRAHPD